MSIYIYLQPITVKQSEAEEEKKVFVTKVEPFNLSTNPVKKKQAPLAVPREEVHFYEHMGCTCAHKYIHISTHAHTYTCNHTHTYTLTGYSSVQTVACTHEFELCVLGRSRKEEGREEAQNTTGPYPHIDRKADKEID